MKRLFAVLTILLGLGVGSSQAQYLIIFTSLNKSLKPGAGAKGGAGVRGGVGMAGALGQAGGQIGIPGGVAGNGGGQIGIPGGVAGNGGGQIGIPGGARGIPGGARGIPSGIQGIPGGAQGIPGGIQGIPPGTFQGGQFGNVGGVPGQKPKDETLRVMAIVELKKYKVDRRFGGVYLSHDWGQTYLMPQKGVLTVEFLKTPDNKLLATRRARFAAEQKKLALVKSSSPQQTIDLARWALRHGLLDKFEELLDNLAGNAKTKSLPVVQSYLKAKANIEKSLPMNRKVTKLKKQVFEGYRYASSDHYLLLHRELADDSPAVKKRLNQLEAFYKGVNYWFALQNKVLPAPQKKMISVLIGGQEPVQAFHNQRRNFGDNPIYTDHFFSPRHQVMALSNTRLGDAYQLLEKRTAGIWDRYNVNKVMKDPLPKNNDWKQAAIAQTYAMVLKSLQQDAELAAVSHGGIRQMIVGAGLIPRNVLTPEWIDFGLGATFEVPVGSPWAGFGNPHWRYHFTFKELRTTKKLPTSPYALLEQVVTDEMFKTKKKGKSSVQARATAWALCHYLLNKQMDGLFRYFNELSKLPRDLELSKKIKLEIFARAVKCVDVRGEVDKRALGKFASRWLSSMRNDIVLDQEKILSLIYKHQNELQAERDQANKPKPRPGGGGTFPGGGFPGGGFPGGFPGGGTPPGTFPGAGGGNIPGGLIPGGGGRPQRQPRRRR